MAKHVRVGEHLIDPEGCLQAPPKHLFEVTAEPDGYLAVRLTRVWFHLGKRPIVTTVARRFSNPHTLGVEHLDLDWRIVREYLKTKLIDDYNYDHPHIPQDVIENR